MFKKSVFSKFSWSAFILLITGFLFLTVLVNNPFIVHAELNNPYYFPALIGIPSTYNNLIDSTIVNSVKSSYESLLANSYGNDVSGNDIIICSYTPNANNEPDFHFTCFNLPEVSVNATEITYRNNGQHYVDIYYTSSSGVLSSPNFYGGWVNSWSTTFNNLFYNGNGWVVYYADPNGNGLFGNDTTLHNQSVLLWTYDATLIPPGSPEVTPTPNNPDLDNPEIDNPTPSTPPTMPQYDPTISVPENIGNWFSWLGSLITYNFNNLFTNIKGFFNNLFNNLKSWLTTLKDVIYNGFKNIIDNFTSLFKPFIDKVSSFIDKVVGIVDHILEIGTIDGVFSIANILKYLFVPDVSALTATFLVHDEFGLVNLFVAAWSFLQSTLPTLYNLPPTYSLHIPSCIYHGQQIGDFDVSFAWFQPFKSYTDLIISGFLVLGWIYWLVTSASGLLRGNTSVISDLSPANTNDKGG